MKTSSSLKNRLIVVLVPLTFLFLSGCASHILQYEKSADLQKNDDYDKRVKVKEIPAENPPTVSVVEEKKAPLASSEVKPNVAMKAGPAPVAARSSKVEVKKGKKTVKEAKKEPDIEDAEDFVGRRPLVDPFRVGEKVTLAVSYFNLVAGYMDLEVLPFVEVNGEKSYRFQISLKTNSIFSRFYSVDDRGVTYLSYDKLVPHNFEISVKESKQLADIRSFFDWKKMKANHWEKRVTKDSGENKKEFEWDIKPYSQNVVSALFYLRTFKLTVGKKLQFRVAEDGKNILFKGEVLRREEIDTEVGKVKSIVVRPEFEVDGVFKPVGEILVWLTDDERKLPVRIESKIKIGTLVAKLKAWNPGQTSN